MAQTLSSVMRIASAHRRAHSTRTAPRAPSVGGVEKGKAEDPQKPVSSQSRAPALALALVIYSCITARFASNIQPHDRVFRVGACSVKDGKKGKTEDCGENEDLHVLITGDTQEQVREKGG